MGGLFLVRVESYDERGDPGELGFDASVEFPPSSYLYSSARRARVLRTPAQQARYGRLLPARLMPDRIAKRRPADRVKRYDDVVGLATAAPAPGYLRFPGVAPGWDNSARRPRGARILVGSTPELYRRWVRHAAARALSLGGPEALLFVNAWNEWAEGCVLEPTALTGHAYLEAHRDAIESAEGGRPRPPSLAASAPRSTARGTVGGSPADG